MDLQPCGSMNERDEKVINIVVIKDPSNWNESSAVDFSPAQVGGQSSAQCFLHLKKRMNVASHPPLYKSQSFTVGMPFDSFSLPSYPLDESSSLRLDGLNPSVPSSPNDATSSVPLNQTPSFRVNSAIRNFGRTSAAGLGDSYVLHQNQNASSHAHNLVESCKTPSGPFQTNSSEVRRTKLVRHKSLNFPVDASVSGPDKNVSYVSSNFIHHYSSNLGSPAVLSSRKDGQESSNSPITATPDSGFCTPSLLSAPFRSLLTSTPVTSSDCPGLNQNDAGSCSPGPGEKSLDSISNNSIGWRESDSLDSAIEEEGHSPLNSSLRSFNWLKTFPIGDSIKPLNISPPVPVSSPLCHSTPQVRVQTNNPGSLQSASDGSQVKENPVSALPNNARMKEKPTVQPCRWLHPSNPSAVPIIMPPLLPGNPVLTTCQFGGVTNLQHARPALGELKINKNEKVKRKKNKGHLFPRPTYSYTDLIRLAIKSSENGQMTLREIVAWIEDHFPFFKHEAKPNWKCTVKQSLSQHSDFLKVDNRPGGKWTLCSTASHQHLPPVTKPEIPSHVLASLNKSKQNTPQPILPKISAYALVPIQNLGLGTMSHSNGVNTVSANPNVIQLPRQQQPQHHHQQKLIHILPNSQQQEGQSHLSQHHPVARHTPMKRSRRKCTKKMAASSATPLSSRLNQNKAVHRTSDPNGTKLYNSLNASQSNAGGAQGHGVKAKRKVLSESGLVAQQILNIQEEKGSRPGEKKIIFVLKDDSVCEQEKNDESQPQQKDSISDVLFSHRREIAAVHDRKSKDNLASMKRKLSNSLTDKLRVDPKRRVRVPKKVGPVMNLQHVLQSFQEDKMASDTIGQLLMEEDCQRGRPHVQSLQASADRNFTQLRPEPKDWHGPPTQKAQLQTRHDVAHHHSNSHGANGHGKSQMSAGDVSGVVRHVKSMGSRKTNILRKINIIKNKSSASKPSILSDKSLTHSVRNLRRGASPISAGHSGIPYAHGAEPTSSCVPSPARPLVSTNVITASQVQAKMSSSDLPRPTFYRTKSRRKQVHVPLTSGISPVRNYDDNGCQDSTFEPKSSFSNVSALESDPESVGRSDDSPTPNFLSIPRLSEPGEHNVSNNVLSNSGSDVENPPSLHFLSTFIKTPNGGNKENVEACREADNTFLLSLLGRSTQASNGRHLNHVSSSISSHGPKSAQPSHHPDSNSHSPHFFSASGNLIHDSSPGSMCTPPCGTPLRPHAATPSAASTSTVFSTHPPQTHLSTLSPSISPGVSRQLNSLLSLTPPCGMAPVSMSTPARPSSRGDSANLALKEDVLEVSPLPGNITRLLDSSFMEHLETFMVDLPDS